jgi:general secretion pathway protein D
VLGDIPILGHLFRDQTRKKVKTNLLLFLTPYIIKDRSDFRRIFERKMKERQQFIELFYGQVPGYDVAIDFARKPGPVARVAQMIRQEEQKAENGGPGLPGERVITPAAPVPPPPDRPRSEAAPPGSDATGQSPAPLAPTGAPTMGTSTVTGPSQPAIVEPIDPKSDSREVPIPADGSQSMQPGDQPVPDRQPAAGPRQPSDAKP